MSPFSIRIRNEVLASFPEWESYALEESWKNSAPYFVVTVPVNGETTETLPLRISTWDEEITVDFDYYHTHFERWNPEPGDSRHQSALLYVRELLAEHIAAASWWQGDQFRIASQWEPGTPLEPKFKVAYTRVRVRSWRGTLDSDA